VEKAVALLVQAEYYKPEVGMVPFPMKPFDFSVELIHPAALRPSGRLMH
jgi:hypothetical protein